MLTANDILKSGILGDLKVPDPCPDTCKGEAESVEADFLMVPECKEDLTPELNKLIYSVQRGGKSKNY